MITLIIFPSVAIAHEEAMESDWCGGGEITILGYFKLNAALLKNFKGEDNAVCSQLRSCGQFDDDDYGISRRTALNICRSFSEAELEVRTIGDHETVRPIFYAPASIKNSELNHHVLYSISQGVEFSCGMCAMPDVVRREAVSKEFSKE
ncbi:hypothetical protein [Aliikangiella coralliicola]|uniref:Uncharacterized protein n=1 Tax=Aliikangiella coralliicola TaxID=2592383 RepID=A0A545UAH8_9GAMM|nr:hypothetical protein [Aliikangiella coralliicola]TQV86470.1 hypothetical protein FLL46_16270 [Aliikangiella coralliicola]